MEAIFGILSRQVFRLSTTPILILVPEVVTAGFPAFTAYYLERHRLRCDRVSSFYKCYRALTIGSATEGSGPDEPSDLTVGSAFRKASNISAPIPEMISFAGEGSPRSIVVGFLSDCGCKLIMVRGEALP